MITDTPITVEQIKEFKQVRTPDYARLAQLINYAKGNERSMAQFADDTEIGASTLSRIINLNIKKPLSLDNIISIYENRADKSDEYLLESLARANGYFPKEYAERVEAQDRFTHRRNEEMNRRNMMKNGIIAGIVAAGLPITEVYNTPILRNTSEVNPLYPTKHGDFVLNIQSETNISIIQSWCFYLFSQRMEELNETRRMPIRMEIRRILERLSSWFLVDAWEPDNLRGMKLSFAFLDEEIFYELIETLRCASVKNEMSLLLINPSNYSVVKEVWLPGEYAQLSNISVFEAAVPNDGFIYDDDDENNENMEDFE